MILGVFFLSMHEFSLSCFSENINDRFSVLALDLIVDVRSCPQMSSDSLLLAHMEEGGTNMLT